MAEILNNDRLDGAETLQIMGKTTNPNLHQPIGVPNNLFSEATC